MLYKTKVNDKGQITIPSQLRKDLKLSEGDALMLSDIDGGIYGIPLVKKTHKSLMSYFGSVDSKGKSTNPEVAINQAKKIKAKEILNHQ